MPREDYLKSISNNAQKFLINGDILVISKKALSVANGNIINERKFRPSFLASYGAGRTVWDMSRRFGVDFSNVTWEMLEQVDHFPIVLVRRTLFNKK